MAKDLGTFKKSDMQGDGGKPGRMQKVNVRKSDRMHGSGKKPSQMRPGNHL